MKERVGIIGAGPAGLTAAYELARRDYDVTVFEASPYVGGMARTISLWGHKVDLGPHRFFTRDERVSQFWREMAGSDSQVVDRMTRIFYGNRFYDYPLRPLNALSNMGWGNACACLLSYLQQKLHPSRNQSEAESFEDWVVSAFGRRLYEMFFQSYSEKLWGIGCDELDADFAAQRIKRFSLAGALLNMLTPGRNQHHTLVDQFHYPAEGTGVVYEQLATRLQDLGGKLHLSTPVDGLGSPEGTIRLQDGTEHQFEHLVSTMPLTLLCASLPDLPEPVSQACSQLSYRNTLLVYLLLDQEELFPDQWLYVQSPELQLGRVTNFRNWSPHMTGARGETVLTLEYWCNPEDELWSQDEASLIQLGSEELRTTGLLGSASVLEGKVIRLPRCYPVYRRGYRDHLSLIVNHLQSKLPHLHAIGRYGAFKYNNQDHSILMGLLAAENVAENADHDLWSINTDYSTYQESSSG